MPQKNYILRQMFFENKTKNCWFTVFPSFRFLRPPSCTLSVFLNNTYIINLTGCAYLILLCSKYYKTKQKICHEDKPKSAIEKKMKITKERKVRQIGCWIKCAWRNWRKDCILRDWFLSSAPLIRHKTQKFCPK